jgi:urease alpha subunit
MRPMFGAFGKAGSGNSIAFVSKVSMVSLFGHNNISDCEATSQGLLKLSSK